jgi:valyl-tRNA synthetase
MINFYRCEEKWIVARSEQEAHDQVKNTITNYRLEQDDDVLDTWFSSGIYPLSTLGWPNNTIDLQTFYPLSLMETGSDILFFWVARMMMLCSYLHSRPFPNVYLHALVRDHQGRKMSKTLGNVIDPMDIIYGSSAEQMKQKIVDNTNISKSEVERYVLNNILTLLEL